MKIVKGEIFIGNAERALNYPAKTLHSAQDASYFADSLNSFNTAYVVERTLNEIRQNQGKGEQRL